jgi:hypothetical protein
MLSLVSIVHNIKRLTSKDNEDFPGTVIWLYYCFRLRLVF